MKTIHKFILTLASEQTVQMNEGAKPLTIDMQYGSPCLWAEVDTDKPMRPVTISVFGTGQGLPEDCGTYLGTVRPTDYLVFHYYINGAAQLCALV